MSTQSLRRSISSGNSRGDLDLDAFYNTDRDASMYAGSNISSEASSDKGWRMARGEELYNTDGNASMHSSSRLSLISNDSMQSTKPSASMHSNLSTTHVSTKYSASMHSNASVTGMAVGKPSG